MVTLLEKSMAPAFLGLPNSEIESADVILLPVAYEGGLSFGRGTAKGPGAIWRASEETELWDDEACFDLSLLSFHSRRPVNPVAASSAVSFLHGLYEEARQLHAYPGLVFSVGGDHSITAPLVRASASHPDDLSDITIVQFDAHADLRDTYAGSPTSHACVMRRLTELGANLIAIGVRSTDQEEFKYSRESGRVITFGAQALARDPDATKRLNDVFKSIRGSLYVTIDVDVLSTSLCYATGTPQPGGIPWWELLAFLRQLLSRPQGASLIGCDIVETVPARHSTVNEVTAALLITKVLAYHFGQRGLGGTREHT